jgi:hypothetical protein
LYTNRGTRTPTPTLTPLNTRSQKKPRWLISDTATQKPQNAKRGPKYQYKLHTAIGLCAIIWLCVIYMVILAPLFACCGLWVAVPLISHLGFFWLLVFRCVCGCACALVCIQFLCFLGFLSDVMCAVAGSLIAKCVWLASRVYVCVRPGKLLCG